MTRAIGGRGIKEPVIKAIARYPVTGDSIIVDTKDSIVAATTESNLRRQTQTEDTVFRKFPLLEEFGYCAEKFDNIKVVIIGTYTPPAGTNQYAREFLEALPMPDSIQAKWLVDLSVTP